MSEKIPPEYRDEIKDCFRSAAARVYRFLYRFTQGDRELCDDLVQETFHEAAKKWRNLHSLTKEQRLAWLLDVARNTAIDVFRQNETRREKWPEVCARYQPADPDVERDAMTSITLEHFVKVTNAMPPERARVANLHWRCGWSNHEIAKKLGISPSRVSQQIQAARVTLRGELGQPLSFESCERGEGGSGS